MDKERRESSPGSALLRRTFCVSCIISSMLDLLSIDSHTNLRPEFSASLVMIRWLGLLGEDVPNPDDDDSRDSFQVASTKALGDVLSYLSIISIFSTGVALLVSQGSTGILWPAVHASKANCQNAPTEPIKTQSKCIPACCCIRNLSSYYITEVLAIASGIYKKFKRNQTRGLTSTLQ